MSKDLQNTVVNSLLVAISEPRLSTYQVGTDPADYQTGFAKYVWNIALSESLYPALQCVEVTMRNSIHDAVSRKYSNNDWFDRVLVDPEAAFLKRAREEVQRRKGKASPNEILSALTFGFWTGLLRRNYEQVLWPQLLGEVFPFVPPEIRTRSQIVSRVQRIRNLRNRVFHHEPVWHWNDLESHHRNILDVIGWINPDMLTLVKLVDRFPETYGHGPELYSGSVLAVGGNGD